MAEYCKTCLGNGTRMYGDSGMGMGPGGQMITEGPCPGTKTRPDRTDCPVVLDHVARAAAILAAVRLRLPNSYPGQSDA